jgi:hypothetical protein
MKHAAAIWTVGGLLAGMALLPGTALAQDWKQYSYPNAGFAVQFPVPPTVQSSTYARPGGASLPMTSYSARQEGIVYRLDVVDFSGTHADATRTIAETEKAMGTTGKVTVAVDARVGRSFGRELSVTGADGGRSAVAIFYVGDHLYILDGHSLPPNAIARSGDAVRFQESLQFIRHPEGIGGRHLHADRASERTASGRAAASYHISLRRAPTSRAASPSAPTATASVSEVDW